MPQAKINPKGIGVFKMETKRKNFKKDITKLVNGYVVASSCGNEFVCTDLNNPDTFVHMGMNAKKKDWKLSEVDGQETLLVPDENGDGILRVCRFQRNSG